MWKNWIAWAFLMVGCIGGFTACSGDAEDGHDTETVVEDLHRRRGQHPWRRGSHWPRPGEKVRICHFPPGSDSPRITEVPERALDDHLAHGDGLAPESVGTNSDCLVPQPPPEPVTTSALTGTDGVARFVIPDTNVRVVVTVADKGGTPLPGMAATVLALGSDYLLVVQDLSSFGTYAPTFQEGSLLDARPGSAPTIAADMVMDLFMFTFPGVGLVQGGNAPQFLTTYFPPVDQCFTEPEFAQRIQVLCDALRITGFGALEIWSMLSAGVFYTATVPFLGAGDLITCRDAGGAFASFHFEGSTAPQRIRMQGLTLATPPGLPPLPQLAAFPLSIVSLGDCGGACCDQSSSAGSCTAVSAENRCASAPSGYHDDVYCSADPCVPPEADVEVVDVQPWPPLAPEPGAFEPFSVVVTNHGPSNAEDVAVQLAFGGPVYDISADFRLDDAGGAGAIAGTCTFASVADQLVCDFGRVPHGAMGIISGDVVASEPGSVRILATATSSTLDPQPSNNNGANDHHTAGWDFKCPPDRPYWNDTVADRACEACPQGSTWNGQTCECTAGTRCGNDCIDLQADPDNCGSCGNACAPSEPCIAGQCGCVSIMCSAADCGPIPDGCGGSLDCGACPVVTLTSVSCSCTTFPFGVRAEVDITATTSEGGNLVIATTMTPRVGGALPFCGYIDTSEDNPVTLPLSGPSTVFRRGRCRFSASDGTVDECRRFTGTATVTLGTFTVSESVQCQ